MKTDDLISLLAQDAPIRTRLGPLLLGALLIGVAVSAALLLAAVGIRHDMASAIETARVLFKMVLALTLAVTACGLVFRIGRPGVPLRHSSLALFVPLILLAGGTAAELSAIPQDSWETAMLGRNAGFCLFFIPVLSLAPLAGFLWALKNGAAERPSLAGAAAGLAAGGIAAALYALHCTDDSPLFLAVWYTTAIAAVTAIGALLGSRYLRW
ncbi:NrsF family protein [Rhizobium yanglingense]